MAFWPWIIGTILVGILIIAIVVCLFALWQRCCPVGVDGPRQYGGGFDNQPHVTSQHRPKYIQ